MPEQYFYTAGPQPLRHSAVNAVIDQSPSQSITYRTFARRWKAGRKTEGVSLTRPPRSLHPGILSSLAWSCIELPFFVGQYFPKAFSAKFFNKKIYFFHITVLKDVTVTSWVSSCPASDGCCWSCRALSSPHRHPPPHPPVRPPCSRYTDNKGKSTKSSVTEPEPVEPKLSV